MASWRARLGYLSPSVFEFPSDWSLILPPGVTLVATGLNVQSHTAEEFDRAIGALESALSVFVAEEVDALLLGGITIATRRGYKEEREIVSALTQRLGIPTHSALGANVDALRHLGAQKIVVATAYRQEINQKLERYFEEAEFEVSGISGLNVARPVDQVKLPEDASYQAALGLFREHPDADAILIHGRWRSVAHAERLERETGRAVVASTAASLWWVLKTLGLKIPVQGYGRLLR
jgi:maleate cis-trans isomerase